jgi:hypothetical protein
VRLIHTIRSAVKAGSLAKAEAARTLAKNSGKKRPKKRAAFHMSPLHGQKAGLI